MSDNVIPLFKTVKDLTPQEDFQKGEDDMFVKTMTGYLHSTALGTTCDVPDFVKFLIRHSTPQQRSDYASRVRAAFDVLYEEMCKTDPQFFMGTIHEDHHGADQSASEEGPGGS